jgi:hypothetical protein
MTKLSRLSRFCERAKKCVKDVECQVVDWISLSQDKPVVVVVVVVGRESLAAMRKFIDVLLFHPSNPSRCSD